MKGFIVCFISIFIMIVLIFIIKDRQPKLHKIITGKPRDTLYGIQKMTPKDIRMIQFNYGDSLANNRMLTEREIAEMLFILKHAEINTHNVIRTPIVNHAFINGTCTQMGGVNTAYDTLTEQLSKTNNLFIDFRISLQIFVDLTNERICIVQPSSDLTAQLTSRKEVIVPYYNMRITTGYSGKKIIQLLNWKRKTINMMQVMMIAAVAAFTIAIIVNFVPDIRNLDIISKILRLYGI